MRKKVGGKKKRGGRVYSLSHCRGWARKGGDRLARFRGGKKGGKSFDHLPLPQIEKKKEETAKPSKTFRRGGKKGEREGRTVQH